MRSDRHRRRRPWRPAMITDKVRPHHLERKAILYVRQSSAHQVLHNRESSALQYAMRDRKHALRRSGGRETISIWDPLFSFTDPAGREKFRREASFFRNCPRYLAKLEKPSAQGNRPSRA